MPEADQKTSSTLAQTNARAEQPVDVLPPMIAETNFRQAIEHIRAVASNTTELGTSFEKLITVFLEHDPTQAQQYEQVWRWADWARDREGYRIADIGVDLVAKIRGSDTYCAVQCKCYDPQSQITKKDLDSFVSAAATKDFSRLLLVDTSGAGLAPNAKQVLDNLDKDYLRLDTSELENSSLDWLTLVRDDKIRLRKKAGPLEHQVQARQAVIDGFAQVDRGKLIMACGTGKTYTSLLIAEAIAGSGGRVLYMVPSLALMSQAIRDWKNDASRDFTAFSACSDQTVGSRKNDDETLVSLHDLAFPATTDSQQLAFQVQQAPTDRMTVVFSTYHSIDVVGTAQREHGMPAFDLIICDEAHRTTGATLVGEDESTFVRIHSDDNMRAAKRLYMTATPRIYGSQAKTKADSGRVELASMDDEALYGPLFFHRGFGWAVEQGLLTDYKVVVLAVDEGIVSDSVQARLADGSELKLDDATKIVGCYKALGKIGFKASSLLEDTTPMRRALAFCQSIKLSKILAAEFAPVVDEYLNHPENATDTTPRLAVDVTHVDGGDDARVRSDRLHWLKTGNTDHCRMLTNVRCLSEGVDVPALDAVIFMHPRKSQIDVVQSVGRVMRKSPEKMLGYVVIPITVAPGVSPEKALNDNDKYRVVWQILNALRSHDERLDSTINRLGLGEDVSDRLEIVGVGARKELAATTAVVPDVRTSTGSAATEREEGDEQQSPDAKAPEQLPFVYADLSRAIKAKIVERCGTRDYWENWAADIARIAQAHIVRIQSIVLNEGTPEREVFDAFLTELQDDLNPSVTRTEAIEMLAQHLVTKPVFDTLFKDHQFTADNAVSKAMQSVLERLSAHSLAKESDSLQQFYDSVRRRAADIVTSTGRQTLITELYERFFRSAFPSMTERLGIVYTPIEVVDFILRSVEDVLRTEFGTSLSAKHVHVLDPFAGTGTFVTRLLQLGIIEEQDLKRKYESELHVNEIVLLAYYIASINIESAYQDLSSRKTYRPFEGIVLTDTFQLYEDGEDLLSKLLPDNSARRKSQKARPINVVVGNPPYSKGQSSANDNAANLKYPKLDARIENTYSRASRATNRNSLYDSYIRAFRLASDRIGDEGVIGFVSNAGWIDGNAADGLRKTFADEFAKIYVFHLRGNARTSGEQRQKESGNVFGEGSRAPIAITILVKRPNAGACEIRFCDIGDYYDRQEKLAIIRHHGSIAGIEAAGRWTVVSPNEQQDWTLQRSQGFADMVPLGTSRDGQSPGVWSEFTKGIKTNKDAWVYAASSSALSQRMESLCRRYNHWLDEGIRLDQVSRDPHQIKWARGLEQRYSRKERATYAADKIRRALYRPFDVRYLYFDELLIEVMPRWRKWFPTADSKNRVLIVSGVGAQSFSVLMSDLPTDCSQRSGVQCFPLYIPTGGHSDLLNQPSIEFSAISPMVATAARTKYSDPSITFEDLFYYAYGVLHSEEYRSQFGNNLRKEMPRVPLAPDLARFKRFVEAGRALGDLHCHFDAVERYPVQLSSGGLLRAPGDDKDHFRVTRMRFGRKGAKPDKTTVIYNDSITISGIPLAAYDYMVNDKPALEWVMERQCVSTDSESGIVNDANDYANETMNNPAYPLELLQRVITISLETMKIVKALPALGL